MHRLKNQNLYIKFEFVQRVDHLPQKRVKFTDKIPKRQTYPPRSALLSVAVVPADAGSVGEVFLASTRRKTHTERLMGRRYFWISGGVSAQEHLCKSFSDLFKVHVYIEEDRQTIFVLFRPFKCTKQHITITRTRNIYIIMGESFLPNVRNEHFSTVPDI